MAKVQITTQEAINEIKNLIASLKTLDNSIQKVNTSGPTGFTKLSSDINALKSVMGTLITGINNLNGVIQTNSRNTQANTTQVKYNTRATKENASQVSMNTATIEANSGALNRNTRARSSNMNVGKMMLRGLQQLAGALGWAGVFVAMGWVIKQSIQLTIKFQSLGYAIDKISSATWEATRSMQFLVEMNENFGASILATTERWLKFRAAAQQSGLTLKQSKDIFESVTKASAVLGLRTDELKGVYLALEQMLSKGKITTEELRRQLGERLPGAMGIMAASMGKTIPELDKMMKKGEVLSAEVLPGFGDALEAAYGLEAVEKVENLQVAVGRLTGAWENLWRVISEGDSILSKTIGFVTDTLTEWLNAWSEVFESVEQANQRLSKKLFGQVVNEQLDNQAEFILKQIDADYQTKKELKDLIQQARQEVNKIVDEGYSKETPEYKKAIKNLNELQYAYTQTSKKIREQRTLNAERWLRDEVANLEFMMNTMKVPEKAWWEGIIKGTLGAPMQFAEGLIRAIETDEETMNRVLEGIKDEKYGDNRLKILRKMEEVMQYREDIERMDPISPLPDDDGSRQKVKIKLHEKYLDSLAEEIEMLRRIKKEEERDFNLEGRTPSEMRASLDEIAVLNEQLNEKLYQQDVRNADQWRISETAKWEEKIEAIKEMGPEYVDLLEKQEAEWMLQQIEMQFEYNDKIALADEQRKTRRADNLEEQWQNDLRYHEKVLALEQAKIDARRKTEEYELTKNLDNTATGSAAQTKAQLELEQKKVDLYNEQVDAQIKFLLNEKRKRAVTDADREWFDNQIAILEATKKLAPKGILQQMYTGEGSWENWTALAVDSLNKVGELTDALFERRIAQIDAEIRKVEELYDTKIKLAEGDEKQQEALEQQKADLIKKLEMKKIEEKQKQARFQRSLSITETIQNTAVAVSSMLTAGPGLGFILAAIAAAMGAAQIAAIVAQPLPQYAEGGEIFKDHFGVINDAGRREYIERDGRILTTDKKNVAVPLKRGDVIYPNFEEMSKRSMLLSGFVGGESIGEDDFQRFFGGIETAIDKGFRRAKINNNIILRNSNEDYARRQARW